MPLSFYESVTDNSRHFNETEKTSSRETHDGQIMDYKVNATSAHNRPKREIVAHDYNSTMWEGNNLMRGT